MEAGSNKDTIRAVPAGAASPHTRHASTIMLTKCRFHDRYAVFEARHVKRSERGRAEGVAVPLEERDQRKGRPQGAHRRRRC